MVSLTRVRAVALVGARDDASPVGGLVDDLFTADVFSKRTVHASSTASTRQYKPKGLFLGTRRDTGEAIDIAPQVLARHGAMLGSTGSG